ncbi:MAG: polysaccharide pyruvyl transferase family protein [Nonlabens sp.]|uniref:polysaccharide pyruvyl transferase family protein n=1 Tax=Nonlabens sp. TaxID=1888209 RepID=UPI003EF6B770
MSSNKIKHGLYDYDESYNFGDDVQSLAAKQYLPNVDVWVDRDHPYRVKDEGEVKLVMNGWYMAIPENFPPPENIKPLFVAMHINSSIKDRMIRPEVIAYFKKHEPIGCRDKYTQRLLEAEGVDAYFSSCLTLTLDKKYHSEETTEEIIFVDALYRLGMRRGLVQIYKNPLRIFDLFTGKIDLFERKHIMQDLFPKEVLDNATFVEQNMQGTTKQERKDKAEEMLHKYAKAKLVVTSRIHAALPCLALGTPVLFLDGGFEKSLDNSRFEGILDWMNIYKAKPSKVNIFKGLLNLITGSKHTNPMNFDFKNPPKNAEAHKPYADKLKQKVDQFING